LGKINIKKLIFEGEGVSLDFKKTISSCEKIARTMVSFVDDKLVLVVDTAQSIIKPHYALAEDGKWWVYVRVKDKSVLASKVVVDVLKHASSNDGVFIQYSSNEKSLLEYLEKSERITVKEYCNLLNLTRRRAQSILVDLVLSGIIRIHTTEKEEYYTATGN
jgi:predicted HTH transcriptional regulator